MPAVPSVPHDLVHEDELYPTKSVSRLEALPCP